MGVTNPAGSPPPPPGVIQTAPRRIPLPAGAEVIGAHVLRALVLVTLLLTLACNSGAPAPTAPTPAPAAPELTPAHHELFAGLALGCIDKPYPYKDHHVVDGPDDRRLPIENHPVFFGCFDWHSAVHGHWMLVRLLKTRPGHALEPQIRAALDAHFQVEALRTETEYFDHPQRRSFERPYGWAWALRLIAETKTWDDPQAKAWARAMRPLERTLVEKYKDYLGKLDWPIRVGTHPNTAFALAQAWDYAVAVDDAELKAAVEKRALDYYRADLACPLTYEPGGQDFFTPCLLEADLMRRVLPREEFSPWLDGFLPTLLADDLGNLADPAIPSDPSDPTISHLTGLSLVRAWTMLGVAEALPDDDSRGNLLRHAAADHVEAGLAGVESGHYEGEHWLASFAVYLLTESGRPAL